MPVFGRKPKQKPQAELLSYYGQELERSKSGGKPKVTMTVGPIWSTFTVVNPFFPASGTSI